MPVLSAGATDDNQNLAIDDTTITETQIEELYKRLCLIHDTLDFHPHKRYLNMEIPEQIMALKFLDKEAVVLELGGSCGRNSCIINTIIGNKKSHVVIEPSTRELHTLEANRNINRLGYAIENCAISKTELFSRGWHTYSTPVQGSVPVKICDHKHIVEKYGKFNTLVVDNEGNFVQMLKDFPEMMDGIHTVIIEHDFNNEDDIAYFNSCMAEHNLVNVGKFMKTSTYGLGLQWRDGVRTDPVFVSAWKKL